MRRGTAGIVLALQLYSIQGLPRIFRHRSELRAAVLQWESPEGREQLLADAGHISTWEVSAVTNMSGLFQELVRFNEDLSAWNTSSVVDLSMAFARASSFNSSIAGWDTSKVVDMSWMFAGASAFNQPIGDWNTSRVQSMQGMFYGAWAFNQSLSSWNTSRVADLSYMFAGAVSFDAAVGRWNTSAVTDMSFLFSSAQAFNQQIGAWNTSSVTNMAGMFLDAKLFSQRVGLWNTSKVLNMSMMFKYAYTFNQPIGGWNTSHVIDMRAMFSYAPNFNRPIGSWDTSRVLSMREMFREADAFSQPLGKWNTTGVIDMSRMFQSANNFNQPLAGWDTSSVANMALMFTDAESFDQPIGGWNTSLVTDMRYMFAGARLFNQPIGEWDTSKVEDMRFMFAGTYTFNQPLHWNTSKARKMFSMFTFTRSFNQPLGHWDTSSVRRIENIFAFAKRFSQPVGSWDMSHVHNPASVFWNANMSDCVKSATRSAWGLEARGNQSGARKRWHARCPACGNSSCGRSDLACVDGFCAPLSAGYVHLGPASWTIEEGLEVGGRGLGACQEACDEQQECLGFLLGRGRCVLHLGQGDPLPLRSHISAWRAFLKATCGSFSCPSNSALKATPSFPQLVTEASCCSCPDPGTVQDLESDKLHLKCSACATGSIPDPAQQNCVSCPPGSVARAGMAHCQVCGLSSKPSDRRGDCIPCGHGQYRPELADECLDCKLPKLLWAEKCVWWHLPLIPIGAIALLLSLCLILSHVKKRHQKEQARVCADQTAVMESLERELWDEEPGTADTLTKYTTALKAFGMKEDEVVAQLEQSRKEQSLRAGVSMRYLLSPDFVYLATSRTNHTDPTFNEMKSFFWQCEDPPPLGLCLRCPRDGRRGCALVDWLPRPERREQTHFLSWAWAYRLSEVRSALHMYQVSTHPPVRTEKVFFFMCFFVNNQFRIIVERSMAGSNVLGEVFKSNLTRLNRVVAILDTWRDPIYLSRVWTIYEQFLASKEQVPVTFTMPFSANESLQQQISRGEVGIWEITQSVSCIDAQNAIAYDPKDEEEVKRAIQETSTFEQVNKHVTDVMARWIGEVVSLQFQQLISVARESRAEGAVVVPSRLEGAASCESLPLSSGSEGICV